MNWSTSHSMKHMDCIFLALALCPDSLSKVPNYIHLLTTLCLDMEVRTTEKLCLTGDAE